MHAMATEMLFNFHWLPRTIVIIWSLYRPVPSMMNTTSNLPSALWDVKDIKDDAVIFMVPFNFP